MKSLFNQRADIVLLHPPHLYDFRKIPQLYGPVSDLVPSTPVFEMYPVGFTSIAECLEKAGYQTRIVNLAWRMLKDSRFDVEKFLSKIQAPVFGIDIHWMVHAHGAIEIARLVKKIHPETRVIVGGFSASRFHKEIIQYSEVDFVMRGDSTEEPMRLFMAALKTGDFASVPNLVWKDDTGVARENVMSYIPDDISNVMGNHYGLMVRQVLRYRDLASVVPFKGWLKHPITAVFTCRGCTRNCLFCGGSARAMQVVVNRKKTVFRTPEDIFKDIQNISRISRGTISILGDIRQASQGKADRLLELLEKRPVKNTLMFEIYEPVPEDMMQRIAIAAPGFNLDMSPHSHDEAVRKALNIDYANQGMEETIESALRLGAGKVEIFFMIGLPLQDSDSVMETIDYCRYLLEKFKGDKRLSLYIGPLGPFLDPGSEAFENPDKHGYRLLFKTFEEHRQALTRPTWKHTLNYETNWLSRQQIMDVTYQAIAKLTQLKVEYGQIPSGSAQAQIERLNAALAIEREIDDMVDSGKGHEIVRLKPEIDRVNNFSSIEHQQIQGESKLIGLRYFSSLWQVIRGR